MALNPQYDAIGKAFTQQYYALFDDAAQRPQLINLYNAEQSLMTFEGQQMQGRRRSDDHIHTKVLLLDFSSLVRISIIVETKIETLFVMFPYDMAQGAAKIMEKIASLTFQKIAHLITAVDCQPMFDGGIVINVLGQLKVSRLVMKVEV